MMTTCKVWIKLPQVLTHTRSLTPWQMKYASAYNGHARPCVTFKAAQEYLDELKAKLATRRALYQ